MSERKRYATFGEFYPFYLSEHSNRTCRRLHFAGTTIGLVCLISALLTRNVWYVLAGLVIGYVLAWIGHFFFREEPSGDIHVPALLVHGRLGDVARHARTRGMLARRIEL